VKISKLIILPLFIFALFLANGCAVTDKYTELSDETKIEEEEVATEEIEEMETDDETYEDGYEDEEVTKEELLEEREKTTERELPDVLKDDPELIRLASETGALYTVYFDYDSYTINNDVLDTIKKNAHWMKSNPFTAIVLEGHADERGSNEYNLALSQRRAMSIEKFLVDFGVNKRNLTVLSYGEEKPANKEKNEEAWRLNRRVELKILK
jgi:peptidoglycan-associated lipoprotein